MTAAKALRRVRTSGAAAAVVVVMNGYRSSRATAAANASPRAL